MAPVQWIIETSAEPLIVEEAFCTVFFEKAKRSFLGRINPIKADASSMAGLIWKPVAVEGATLGAEVIKAGFILEAQANSRSGAGSIIGSRVGVSIERSDGDPSTVAQLWQGTYRSQYGVSQLGGVLKGQVQLISKLLESSGHPVEYHKNK